MKIDFTKHKLHLVITPLDMRLGCNRLCEITLVYLHIAIINGQLGLHCRPCSATMHGRFSGF